MPVEEEDFKRGGVEKVGRKRKVEHDLFKVKLLHILFIASQPHPIRLRNTRRGSLTLFVNGECSGDNDELSGSDKLKQFELSGWLYISRTCVGIMYVNVHSH